MAGEKQIALVDDVNESYPLSPMQWGMLGHFQSVLKGMAANLSQRVADLPLLADAEQRQLLAEWNDTDTDFPRDKCVHELFETQVERTPNTVALVYNKEEVSYRELDNQANRVARHLRSLAVGPRVPVGICVQRSTDMLVDLPGILKAGGAYVPLRDPFKGNPAARLYQTCDLPNLCPTATSSCSGAWTTR